MTMHVRDPDVPTQREPMAPIRPEVEALLRRRASAAAAHRPRKRMVATGTGAAIFAVCAAALILTLGSPSQNGLLSPERAVAQVAQTLDGQGVLHWIRRGNLSSSDSSATTLVEDQWTDLATGNSHTTRTELLPSGEASSTLQTWAASGRLFMTVPSGADGSPRIREIPGPVTHRPGPFSAIESIADVRATLERAERGEADIADAGEDHGVPLVVVTDRSLDAELQTWITREADPRIVKIVATVLRAAGAVTTTTVTQTWAVVPQTAGALANVALPPTAPPDAP